MWYRCLRYVASRVFSGVLFILVLCLAYAFAQDRKPLTLEEILFLVTERVSSERLVELIEKHGVGFEVDERTLGRLRQAGATEPVVAVTKRMGRFYSEEKEKKQRLANELKKQAEEANKLAEAKKREQEVKRKEEARRQEEEIRRKAEAEVRRKVEEEKRRIEEAGKREEVRKKELEEARRRDENAAKKIEAERILREDSERKKRETIARRKAEEEERKKQEEARRKEDEKRKAEAEASARAEEDKRKIEEVTRREDAQKKEEALTRAAEAKKKAMDEAKKREDEPKSQPEVRRTPVATAPPCAVGLSLRFQYPAGETFTRTISAREGELCVVGIGSKFFYDKDWVLVKQVEADGKAITSPAPTHPLIGEKWLQFPLQVGKKWEQRYRARYARFPGVDSFTNYFSVLDYEAIKVLAGTFQAFKIKNEQMNLSGQRGVQYFWYAPEAGYYVKRKVAHDEGSTNYWANLRDYDLISISRR